MEQESLLASLKGKRIAILLPRLSRYGGMENFGFQLAERLAQAGAQVDFICARVEQTPPPGVRACCLGRPGVFSVFKMLHFAWAAERQRRNGGYALSIGLGKTLRQDILRIGGGAQRVFHRKSLLAYQAGLPRILKKIARSLSPANFLTNIIEAIQLRNAKVIVVVSDLLKQWTLETYPQTDPDKIKVIYNKPDLSRFTPIPASSPDNHILRERLLCERQDFRERWGVKDNDLAVGLAGTNFSLKGVEPAIRALALLPQRYKLLVAGGRGSARYLRLAQELGLNNNAEERRVLFVGKVENMPSFYRALDIFVLPTFYDACSNAVLEALACGIPSLTSASNGAAHFLPPECILHDPADYHALARTLEALKTPVRKKTLFGDKAFSWPKNCESGIEVYINLIQQLLSKRDYL